MSITYPLSLPSSPKPRALKLSAFNLAASTQSPFSASYQVQLWPGEGWMMNVTLPPIKDRATAESWQVFFLSLRGIFGTFESPCDYSYTGPRGVATGTPLINGANAAQSLTLATKGWTHSITGILKKGDFIQVQASGSRKRLHKILNDANSDSSGNATLDIFPRLREALADGSTIVKANPVGTFQLAANQRDFDIDEASIFSFSFQAVEAL